MLGQFFQDKDNRAGGSKRESVSARNRASMKSILKHEKQRKTKKSAVGVRFKDQCRTSHPYLSFFSKESRYVIQDYLRRIFVLRLIQMCFQGVETMEFDSVLSFDV